MPFLRQDSRAGPEERVGSSSRQSRAAKGAARDGSGPLERPGAVTGRRPGPRPRERQRQRERVWPPLGASPEPHEIFTPSRSAPRLSGQDARSQRSGDDARPCRVSCGEGTRRSPGCPRSPPCATACSGAARGGSGSPASPVRTGGARPAPSGPGAPRAPGDGAPAARRRSPRQDGLEEGARGDQNSWSGAGEEPGMRREARTTSPSPWEAPACSGQEPSRGTELLGSAEGPGSEPARVPSRVPFRARPVPVPEPARGRRGRGSGAESAGERQHPGTSIFHKMPAATEGERDREQSRISHSFLVVFFY